MKTKGLLAALLAFTAASCDNAATGPRRHDPELSMGNELSVVEYDQQMSTLSSLKTSRASDRLAPSLQRSTLSAPSFSFAGSTGNYATFDNRADFAAVAGAVAYNYGFEDFASDLFSFPPNPWTTNGVTYSTTNNLIVGPRTGFEPPSRIFCYNAWTPVAGTLSPADAYTVFGAELSVISSSSPTSYPIDVVITTNLDTYRFDDLNVPKTNTKLQQFFGFVAKGTGEYITGFELSSTGVGIGPCLDNVTVGHLTPVTPGPGNVAPTADARGPYAAEEGSPVTVTGSATDPDAGATLAYSWDFDGDGVTDAASAVAQHTYSQDGEYKARLIVSDGTLADTAEATITVANALPIVHAGPDQSVLSFGTGVEIAPSFTDPGTDAPWHYSIEWSDGGEASGTLATGDVSDEDPDDGENGDGALPPVTFAAPFAGTFTITVKVSDDDGESSDVMEVAVGKTSAQVTLEGLEQQYDGSPRSASAKTDPAGLKVDLTYDGNSSAPTNVGSYTVVATIDHPGYEGSATGTLEITKAGQTISFGPLGNETYGDQPFAVSATASSGLRVDFSSSGDCSVSGTTVTISRAGSCTITASQDGNGNYHPAKSVQQTFAIAKATPTITWSAPAAITYGRALSGTQLNAQANVAGSVAYNPDAGAVLGAGSHALTATFTPADADNYNGAQKTVTLTVNKATPVITWNHPADIVYGTVLGSSQLNATADVPGGFTYTPAAGTKLGAGTGQTLRADFLPTDASNYSAASATVPINVKSWTLTGFYQPIAMRTPEGDIVYNTVKAGTTVPLKFNVFEAFQSTDRRFELTTTGAIGATFAAQKLSACEAGATEDSVDDLATTGSTSLQYDLSGAQFVQNWQTPQSTGCYRVTMTTADKSVIEAYFKLK